MRLKIVLIIIMCNFSFLYAQQMELSWKDCVDITFKNNPELKSKQYSLKQAEYSYFSSLNSYYPQISLNHSFSRSGGDNSSVSNRFSASASMSQSLFNLKTISSIKSAKINYDSAKLNYESFVLDLRKNLYSAYLNLYFAQKTVEVNKRILEIREENAKLIKLKYESGMESKGNMLYANAQYEMSKLDLKKSERNLRINMENLAQITGLKDYETISIKDEIDVPNLDFDIVKIEEYINKNPDLKSYIENIKLAKEKLNSASYDLFPNLNFNSSYGYSGNSEFPEKKSWSFGLSMSLPIFSNGITYYKNNKLMAENMLKANEEQLNNYKISLKASINNAYDDFLNSVDTVNTYKILLNANEERYKEGQIKYMAGSMSFIDLENLEQNLIDSKLNYINYIQTANLKKINLERYISVGF